MAYVVNEQDNEKTADSMDVFGEQETQVQEQPQVTTQGITTGVAKTARPSPKVPRRRTGTGFTNLRKYIEANVPQAQRLAESVVGKTQEQAQKVKAGTEEAQQRFQKELEPEKQRLEQAEQFTRQLVESAVPGQELTQSDVERYKQLTEQRGKFKNIGGPDYTQAAREAQRLQQLGRQAGTTAGRFQLLQQTLGGAQPYTAGQRTLDELILAGSAPASQRIIAGTREATGGIAQDIAARQEASRKALLSLRQQAGQAQQAARGELGEIGEELQAGIAGRLAEAETARQEEIERVIGGLERRELTAEDIQRLGLRAGESLYGIDPSQYIKASVAPKFETIASPEEVARYQAIRQLSGEVPFYVDKELLELTPEAAATYDPTAVTGVEELRGAIETRRQQYEAEKARQEKVFQDYQRLIESGLGRLAPITTIGPIDDPGSRHEYDRLIAQAQEPRYDIREAERLATRQLMEDIGKGTVTQEEIDRLFAPTKVGTAAFRSVGPRVTGGDIREGLTADDLIRAQAIQRVSGGLPLDITSLRRMADLYRYMGETQQRLGEQYQLGDIIRQI
jgi:hypothetical protein